MYIGRRLYFDKTTGNIILDKGEMQGDVVEKTIEQDFETYKVLQGLIPETVGVVQLEYGQYKTEFETCNGFHVNTADNSIVFNYTPEVELERTNSVEQQLATLQEQNLILMDALATVYEKLEAMGGTM